MKKREVQYGDQLYRGSRGECQRVSRRPGVKFNEDELKDLKASLKKSKDENETLKSSVDAWNIQLKTAKEKLQTQKEEYDQLWENLDHLEQYSRKNSLEIYGVPQDAYTSTESVVIKVAEALYVTVEPEEIEISHKINRGKSILVKFCSHKTKSKIYKEHTKLKHVKIKDIFRTIPPQRVIVYLLNSTQTIKLIHCRVQRVASLAFCT